MNIMAIETSSKVCSIALQTPTQLFHQELIEEKKHTQIILPLIDHLLKEAHLSLDDLDAIAFSAGPGSFTGLRIAASVTQAIAFVHQLPVIPVSSLWIQAQSAYRVLQPQQVKFFIAVDARMNDAYIATAEYCPKQKQMVLTLSPQLIALTALQNHPAYSDQTFLKIGDAWSLLENVKPTLLYHDIQASAIDLLHLATAQFEQGISVASNQALPYYLREMHYTTST
jgi:tRNA threonylcarbamoyladenosine biosynthesis protein TsaB